ncbi:hypothetical protein GCM10010353_30510 [Streptomyces chryseus]|nr:hypothetical protein GCM10010353_30510 [Streptomyces chryseus]
MVAAGLSLVLLPTAQAAAGGTGGAGRDAAERHPSAVARGAHTVTLITGDKVTVADLGGGRKSVTEPASGHRGRGRRGPVRHGRRAGQADGVVRHAYDLSEGHPGAVPDEDLTYRPGQRELAVLDTKFHAAKAADGSDFRYSITGTFPVGFGFQEKVAFPAERTDYVSTGPGQRWHESVTNGPGAIEQRSGTPVYRGGARSELNWFKPVLHPWLGTGLGWGQQRSGNDLMFNTPGWGDSGPDHTGFGDVWSDDSMTRFTEVYAGGELVDRKTSSGVYAWDADPAEQTYRVVTPPWIRTAGGCPPGATRSGRSAPRRPPPTGSPSFRCSTSASTWTPA